MPARNTGAPVKAIQERPIMTHYSRTRDLIHSAKAALSRTHYRHMWRRMRDGDSFGDSSPSICSITKEVPALVCGSDRSHTPTHKRKSPTRKQSNVTAKVQSSKITGSSCCTTSSGDVSGTGDDDDGGDSDPDGPSAIASRPLAHQNNHFETTSPSSTAGLLRLPQVLKIFPVSKSTWWSGVKTGRYPAPVKPSRRTTAWRHSDIMDLIESLATGTSARASQEVSQ